MRIPVTRIPSQSSENVIIWKMGEIKQCFQVALSAAHPVYDSHDPVEPPQKRPTVREKRQTKVVT